MRRSTVLSLLPSVSIPWPKTRGPVCWGAGGGEGLNVCVLEVCVCVLEVCVCVGSVCVCWKCVCVCVGVYTNLSFGKSWNKLEPAIRYQTKVYLKNFFQVFLLTLFVS